jgi:hypothetical protein
LWFEWVSLWGSSLRFGKLTRWAQFPLKTQKSYPQSSWPWRITWWNTYFINLSYIGYGHFIRSWKSNSGYHSSSEVFGQGVLQWDQYSGIRHFGIQVRAHLQTMLRHCVCYGRASDWMRGTLISLPVRIYSQVL